VEWPQRRLTEVRDELVAVLPSVDDEARKRVAAMLAAVEKAIEEGKAP
jgi:hypothetical protein